MQCPRFLFGAEGQAQAWSTEASGKGFHISRARPRPAGRQDGGHRGAQDGLTTSAFDRRRPPLVRIACTSCPFQNGRCWIPSRSIFGDRTRASINRASHHDRGDGSIPPQAHHKAQEHLSSRGCSSLVLFIVSPRGNPPPPHRSRVFHHNTGPNLYKSCVSCVVSSSC